MKKLEVYFSINQILNNNLKKKNKHTKGLKKQKL
jgi:hypothetical protein